MKRSWLLLTFVLAFWAAGGTAGEGYWQQDVRYEIRVSLDTEDHTLAGHETLHYTNNSPDTLRDVWFHAYPNAYKDNNSVYARECAAAGQRRFHFAGDDERGFIDFQAFQFESEDVRWEYKPGDETEIRVELPRPIPPGGASRFDIDFFVKIPAFFSRLGHKDDHYEISQWYPKIVVYDSRGWHPDGYHIAGEFYGEFGTFDVWVTLPSAYVVAASGVLVGPEAETAALDSLAARTARVASLTGRDRKKALKHLEKAAEAAPKATKTLHFRAENVHDFAWFVDRHFLLKRGHFGDVAINVYVRPEHEQAWKDVVDYVHDTLHYYGAWYGPYAYTQMSVVDGMCSDVSGMEYPGITVVSADLPPFLRSHLRVLEMVVMHETGHQWFYGLLGSNEMDEAWLDEGINTFSEQRYMETKYGRAGNWTDWPRGLRWLPEFDDRTVGTLTYHSLGEIDRDEPILKPAYAYREGTSGYALSAYWKAAWMMWTLREALGDSVFDDVMLAYVGDWRFKHPHTEDFIEVAERVSGRDLGSFFHDFLRTSRKCDYRVGDITTTATAAGRRVVVEIINKGEITLPSLPVRLTTRDGKTYDRRWEAAAARGTLAFETEDDPASVEIDPNRNILEIDHWNNRRPEARRWSCLGLLPSFYEVDHTMFFYPWYDDDVDHLRLGLKTRRGNPVSARPVYRAGVNYAFGSHRWGYSASVKTRLPLNGNRTFIDFSGKDVEGYNQQRITLTSTFGPRALELPQLDVTLEAFRNDVYDLRYYEPADWETGRTGGLQASLNLKTRGVHHDGSQCVRVRHCVKAAQCDFDYTKAEGEFSLAWRWTRRFQTRHRLYVAGIQGAPARQDRIYLAGGVDADRRNRLVLDRRGTALTPLERWIVPGGAGLRGYSGVYTGGIHAAGHYALGVGLEAVLKIGPLVPTLFLDFGNVWPERASMRLDDLRADAGVQLELGPVAVVFPLWLSDPSSGDEEWDFRWLVGIRSSSISLGP
jgi:hypothetical protein